MQLALPTDVSILFQTLDINGFYRKFFNDVIPCFCSFFNAMIWIFIDPMLKFINGCDPWKYGDHSFKLVFFRASQVIIIFKKNFPNDSLKKVPLPCLPLRQFPLDIL